jgi:cytochrome c2
MVTLRRYARVLAAGIPLFSVLLVTPAARSGQQSGALSGNPSKGRYLFINRGCARCHSIGNLGRKIGPDLSSIGRGKSFLQIAASLWNHAPGMAKAMAQQGIARPAFTSEEMNDLVFYFYYLNYSDKTGDRAMGLNVFSRKGCINCHSVRGIGASVAPSLDKYQKDSDPFAIAQAMWNHGPRMAEKMEKLGITSPQFLPKEMTDLMAFICGPNTSTIPNRTSTLAGDAESGRRLFTQKSCLRCHSINGRGGAIGPDLTNTQSYNSVGDIAGAMWNHSAQMSQKMRQAGLARTTFSGNQLADVIAYIYLSRYTDRRGNAARGEKVLGAKGCAECHSVGFGQKIGPDLSASDAAASPANLMAAMWNHAPKMEKIAQEKGLPWPRLEGEEMRDLVQYLKSRSKLSPRKAGE